MLEVEYLNDFEFSLLRLALPELIKDDSYTTQIIFHYYDKLSDEQCVKLFNSLRLHELSESWNKFTAVIDRPNHYIIQTMDEQMVLVFDANNKVCPVTKYTSYPEEDMSIPSENIKVRIK